MATPTNASREYPSTYFVHDRGSAEELNRLHLQDELVTAGMGGILSEQSDPSPGQEMSLKVDFGTCRLTGLL